MDEKKVAEEIAILCQEIHRETRGKKKPNVVVGPPEYIDLIDRANQIFNHMLNDAMVD